MTLRSTKVAATLALTGAFWVVPSLGTQGMGTIRERFVHADRDIFQIEGAADTGAQQRLQRADLAVEAAVIR